MISLICILYFGVQALYDRFLRNGLSELQRFFKYQKAEIMKILEEESSQLTKVAAEIQDKLTFICINTEVSEHPVDEMQCCDSSCKDVHVTTDISLSTCTSPKVCTRRKQTSFPSTFMLSLFLCLLATETRALRTLTNYSVKRNSLFHEL